MLTTSQAIAVTMLISYYRGILLNQTLRVK